MRQMKRKLVGGAIAVAAVASGCGSLTVERAEAPVDCGIGVDLSNLDRSNGDVEQSVTHLIVHSDRSTLSDRAIRGAFSDSATRGDRLHAWRLESGNAANLQVLGDWNLRGTARNKAALRAELTGITDRASCDFVARLAVGDATPTEDKGADLAGALVRVLRDSSVAEAEGRIRIVVLTHGGVHRTHQLDLGDPNTGPDDWQAAVDQIATVAVSATASTPLAVEILGVGASSEPVSAVVLDNTRAFWDDVCAALQNGKGEISCSAHS